MLYSVAQKRVVAVVVMKREINNMEGYVTNRNAIRICTILLKYLFTFFGGRWCFVELIILKMKLEITSFD